MILIVDDQKSTGALAPQRIVKYRAPACRYVSFIDPKNWVTVLD